METRNKSAFIGPPPKSAQAKCFFVNYCLKMRIFFTEPKSAICGNKVVEEGEECDCGYADECNDNCCVGQPIGGNAGVGCKRATNVSCR